MALQSLRVDQVVKQRLDADIKAIETKLERDVLTIVGPIVYGLDESVREAVEAFSERKAKIAVVLDTPGGIVEVVERMVETIRHFYEDVMFIVPDRAMSAGTIFVMSGDSIMMDYFSRLGPIDPQVEKDGKLVPALSYLVQYKRLLAKDRKGELTSAEYVLLEKFDLAELHQYEQARTLSIRLLRQWLAKYKFKNWTQTETARQEVTSALREQRAEQIAKALSDNELWNSHGRGISRATLESDEIKLKIDDLNADEELHNLVRAYYTCLRDFIRQMQQSLFVHTRNFF